MLVLTRKYHEKIRIGDDIVITVLKMKGKSVRLGIEAPDSIAVLRGELEFDLDSADVEAVSKESVPAEPKARAVATRANRIPATVWAENAKPRVSADSKAGRGSDETVLHERVPRRRLSQMMPPLLGRDPSRVT